MYMPLMLPCFIDQGPLAVARDFLIKTTYWPLQPSGFTIPLPITNDFTLSAELRAEENETEKK